MNKSINNNLKNNKKEKDNIMHQSIKITSKFSKQNIEKSYSIDTIACTEAYFSNRYGWTLKRR